MPRRYVRRPRRVGISIRRRPSRARANLPPAYCNIVSLSLWPRNRGGGAGIGKRRADNDRPARRRARRAARRFERHDEFARSGETRGQCRDFGDHLAAGSRHQAERASARRGTGRRCQPQLIGMTRGRRRGVHRIDGNFMRRERQAQGPERMLLGITHHRDRRQCRKVRRRAPDRSGDAERQCQRDRNRRDRPCGDASRRSPARSCRAAASARRNGARRRACRRRPANQRIGAVYAPRPAGAAP